MDSIAEMDRRTIMVVEDDELVAAIATDILEDAGYEVIGVTAAEDALGLALMDVPFDALFTDINLAGPLDGWELAEALREMRPDLPVVYTSAAANGVSAHRVASSFFLAKPYKPTELLAVMQRLVTSRLPAAATMSAMAERAPATELRLIA